MPGGATPDADRGSIMECDGDLDLLVGRRRGAGAGAGRSGATATTFRIDGSGCCARCRGFSARLRLDPTVGE